MKIARYMIFILLLLIVPNFVSASEKVKICEYKNSRVLVYINIYDDGTVKSVGHLMKNGEKSGTYHSERKIGNSYTDVDNCPKYVLVTYPGHDDKKYYVSNSKSDLEAIITSKDFLEVDFETYDLLDSIGKNVLATIISLEEEIEASDDDTKVCNYSSEITGCDNCEISLEFWTSGNSYDVGESSVVQKDIIKGNINSINLVGDEWNKREFNTSSGQTTIPFTEYLISNQCPEGLVFKYDEDSKNLNIYVGETAFSNSPEGKVELENNINEMGDCSSLFGTPTDKGSPAYYLSIVFSIIRYVAIILLIVLTVIDFVGATASQDNDILKKATNKAIKRAILCVIIFLLPTLIDFVLTYIHESSISDCIDVNINS